MKNPVRKIIVVYKTHFDIGFTGLSSEIIQSYSKVMLPDVVETCSATRDLPEGHRFVWTMPAWPLMHAIQSEDTHEETKRDVEELIGQNQIRWHALPFTTHTEFCGLEEFIRGIYFSRRLSDAYGKWPVSAKMTDVPGHTRMLPSLLNKAGVKFLHLGCNPFSTPPDVPRLFNWVGPDGGSVLTFYNKGEYGTSLVPPEDWPFPVWLALMNTGDNHGPQKPEIIQNILQEVESKVPGTEVVMGTLDDFYNDMKGFADFLPVVRGDLADSWIHGVGSYPREVAAIRLLRQRLVDTEKAFSLGVMAGLFADKEAADLKQSFDDIYEKCILFGEHTWGLDVKQMGEKREYEKARFKALKPTALYQRMEQSWDEKKNLVIGAMAELEKMNGIVMQRWARSAAEKGGDLLVFNGMARARNGWVSLKKYVGPSDRKLIESSTRQPVPTRTVNGERFAFVEGVQPLGFKRFTFVESEAATASVSGPDHENNVTVSGPPDQESTISVSGEEGTIENKWYKIAVDRNQGVITSLFDKTIRHEWVHPSISSKFGQYHYDVYGDQDITEFIRSYAYRFYTWGIIDYGRAGYPQQRHLTFIPERFRMEVKEEEGSATLTVTAATDVDSVLHYGNAAAVSMSITLYALDPYIDVSFQLTGKEETPFVEAGHVMFPINLQNPRFAVQKLGQVVDPAADIVPNANHVLYCCDQWVDVSDGEKGLAVIPLDTPLFSIGEKGLLKFQKNYEEKDPTLVFNLFNNSWGTNFPQWMGGDYTFRYRLLPHKGDWREGNVAKRASETFAPFLTWVSASKSAHAAPPDSLIELEEDMEVLCLKPAEQGDGFIFRVHDTKGVERQVQLAFEREFTSLETCDLLEVRQKTVKEHSKEYAFVTRPFEVHTFLVKI